jgi:murein DD-endopeptidase MepM/ murein hydrolase activator NlpD
VALSREQQALANLIVSIGRKRRETPKEIKAAIETGLVEANLTNPSHGDGTSVGWRQETASSYPNVNRLDVRASINRFYNETSKVENRYRRASDIAAAVQRPAAQYRGRYQGRSGEAQQILRSIGGTSGAVPADPGTAPTAGAPAQQAPPSSAGTVLADMLAEQLQRPQQQPSMGLQDPSFSARKNIAVAGQQPVSSGAPPAPKLAITDQIAAVRRIQTGEVPQPPADSAASAPASGGKQGSSGRTVAGRGGSAVGRPGKLIGFPYQGTHTLGNWQSDHAVDIAVPRGTPILATEDGVIRKTGGQASEQGRFGGRNITLNGRRDNYFYAHLSRVNVKAGDRVRRGQVIGLSGSANGVAHLHFGREHGNPAKND